MDSGEHRSSELDLLKSGHTISLNGHSSVPLEMIRPRSSHVLLSRGPSFPALQPDLSSEFTRENLDRKILHSKVLSADSGAFRRRHRDESASTTIHNLSKVRHLLEGMHEMRDFQDINKSRIYTRSRLLKERLKEEEELEIYHSDHLHPLEDFVRPYDLESRRNTGYEYGHIRSLLKLDTFGPANSASILKKREEGELPPSPNLDRHNLLSPEHELKPATLIPMGSSNSSRASSADDSTTYHGAFPSLQSLRRNTVKTTRAQNGHDHHHLGRRTLNTGGGYSLQKSNDDIRSLFHETSDPIDQSGKEIPRHTLFAGPAPTPAKSLRLGSSRCSNRSRVSSRGTVKYPDTTFHGVAITEHERSLKDPYLRRNTWFKSFQHRLQDEESRKQLAAKRDQLRRKQQVIAQEEKQIIDEFENRLTLAKFRV